MNTAANILLFVGSAALCGGIFATEDGRVWIGRVLALGGGCALLLAGKFSGATYVAAKFGVPFP